MAEQSLDKQTLKRDKLKEVLWGWARAVVRHRLWFTAGGVVLAFVAIGVGLGLVYVKQQRLEASERFFEIDQNPKLSLEEKEEALRMFIQENPKAGTTPLAWSKLAHQAWQQNQPEKAKEAFEALVKHPKAALGLKTTAKMALAHYEQEKGNPSQAEDIYNKLPKLYEDAKLYSLAGLALLNGEEQKALELFSRLVQEHPTSVLASRARQVVEFYGHKTQP